MCSEHDENASDILIDWLKSHSIKFDVNIILLNHGSLSHDTFKDITGDTVTLQDKVAAKVRPSSHDRELLQSG